MRTKERPGGTYDGYRRRYAGTTPFERMKSTRPVKTPEYSERVRSPGLALVVALCAFATVGCGGSSPEPAAAPDAPPTETQPTTSPPRASAPSVEGTSVDGKPISLADYRGQAVLINVWSSW